MWWPLYLSMLLTVALPIQAEEISDPTICKSIEINSVEDFKKLRHCKVVVGHVRLANIEFPLHDPDSEFGAADLAAHIKTNVEEITDYLLVYRVNGLKTLEGIFPRLRIIRGHELLFNEYSLTVYECRNLYELGLISMLRIQRGNVRIESNPMLCFVQTVNWVYLLANSTAQHYSIQDNKSPNHCPVCMGLNADYAFRENGTKYCWNMKTMQQRPTTFRYNACPDDCGSSGCDEKGTCCSRSCVTGCNIQNCELCANFKNRITGKCVEQCAVNFILHKRECITANECRGMLGLPVGNECLEECPDTHRSYKDSNNQTHCRVSCSGHYVIKQAENITALRDCVTLRGTLTIELENIKEKIVGELERALSSIKEITGWLKVHRSPQLVSLSFLKNLDTIGGEELLENKYAFFVVGNANMEQIWIPNHQVAIQRGNIFFHLNPRLCYEKIKALQPSLRTVQELSVSDVSHNSNGERVICGRGVRNLEAVVEDYNATAVRIAVDIMRSEHLDLLIGYTYHYKEAPERNITMYDGRHGCGHDDWLMDLTITQNRRHILSNLKPYTQYAFFVKTVTRTDYHTKIEAYSKIYYFRTLAAKPTPVAKIYAESPSTTQILIHWWPPLRPNGVIANYYVTYEPVQNLTITNVENAPLDANCECNNKSPYNSGPLPDDEDFYNKEQIIYEEGLPNLIYVSNRQRSMAKKEKFGRVEDYNALVNPPPSSTTTEIPRVETTTRKPVNKTFAAQAERNYNLYRQKLERQAILIQDSGPEEFPILKPLPICKDKDATPEFMSLNNCTVPESVQGTKVNGTQHFMLLKQLKEEHTYRISIRACVDGIANGCSKPTSILATTVTKNIEEILHRHSY